MIMHLKIFDNHEKNMFLKIVSNPGNHHNCSIKRPKFKYISVNIASFSKEKKLIFINENKITMFPLKIHM